MLSRPDYFLIWWYQREGFVFLFVGCERGGSEVQFDDISIILGYCFYFSCYVKCLIIKE